MAAPKTKTLKDLNGTWTLNKTLSDSIEPALTIQGIGWILRKAISNASITLKVSQYSGPPAPAESLTDPSSAPPVTHIDINQLVSGLSGTTELRNLDNRQRSHKDWLFGEVTGQSRWVSAAALPKEVDGETYLIENGSGWLENEEEKAGPEGETHILSLVQSVGNGWKALQIWGFQTVEGERRYVRNVAVTKKAEKALFRLVYDFVE